MGKYYFGFSALLILVFFTPDPVSAQGRGRYSTYYAAGVEVDLLPYLSGGYYGSLWWGADHVRVRGVVARTQVPGFFLPDGFEENNVLTFALIGDYFFEKAFKGLWVGGGAEYWDASVVNSEDKAKGYYTNYVVTAGAGYVFKIWKGLYLNPWAAFHLAVSGDRELEVGNATFKTAVLTPEISLKIGYHIPLSPKKTW